MFVYLCDVTSPKCLARQKSRTTFNNIVVSLMTWTPVSWMKATSSRCVLSPSLHWQPGAFGWVNIKVTWKPSASLSAANRNHVHRGAMTKRWCLTSWEWDRSPTCSLFLAIIFCSTMTKCSHAGNQTNFRTGLLMPWTYWIEIREAEEITIWKGWKL